MDPTAPVSKLVELLTLVLTLVKICWELFINVLMLVLYCYKLQASCISMSVLTCACYRLMSARLQDLLDPYTDPLGECPAIEVGESEKNSSK